MLLLNSCAEYIQYTYSTSQTLNKIAIYTMNFGGTNQLGIPEYGEYAQADKDEGEEEN